MTITAHALTHPGLRRESNEDCCTQRPGLGLWVVCDGMGGHAAGEVASRVAADTIEAFIETSVGVDARTFTWPFGFDAELGFDGTRLMTAFRLANRAITVRMADEPELRGMATTGVALLLGSGDWGSEIREDKASSPASSLPKSTEADYAVPARRWEPPAPSDGPTIVPGLIAHVGDSRAYLWHDGDLIRLTRDHSWVEEQLGLGLLTEAEARTHPWRNLVTRALAGGIDPTADISPVALEPGDRVLLCSDGLCGVVTDALIRDVIGKGRRGDVEATCQTLIDAANAAGGPDNITVVLVEVS